MWLANERFFTSVISIHGERVKQLNCANVKKASDGDLMAPPGLYLSVTGPVDAPGRHGNPYVS